MKKLKKKSHRNSWKPNENEAHLNEKWSWWSRWAHIFLVYFGRLQSAFLIGRSIDFCMCRLRSICLSWIERRDSRCDLKTPLVRVTLLHMHELKIICLSMKTKRTDDQRKWKRKAQKNNRRTEKQRSFHRKRNVCPLAVCSNEFVSFHFFRSFLFSCSAGVDERGQGWTWTRLSARCSDTRTQANANVKFSSENFFVNCKQKIKDNPTKE